MLNQRKILVLIIVLSSLAMVGCDQPTLANHLKQLTDTSWKIEGIPKRVTATMSFGADGRVTGNSGCNRYFGTYETSGQSIKISNIGGTKKICPEVEMSVEKELLKTFEIVNQWQGTSENLVLTAPVDKTIIRLTRLQQPNR